MELDRLKQFYYVAREENLSKAAHYLNISHSALSRSITLFEYRLGCKLFIRLVRGLKLTLEGQKLYEFACRVIKESTLLGKTLKQNNLEGELIIGISPYLNGSWLIEQLHGYLVLHSDIKLRILNLYDHVYSDDVDVIIGFENPYLPDSMKHILCKTHIGLFASPTYLKKMGTPQQAEDLKDHHLISYNYHHDLPYKQKSPWLLTLGDNRKHREEPYLKVSTLDDLLLATSKGLGITELPWGISAIEKYNLVPILAHLKGHAIELALFYPKELKEQLKVQSLKKYLKQHFK